MTPGEEIAVLKTKVESLIADLKEVKDDTESLKRFQSWLIGLWTGAGIIVGIIGNSIKTKLGL